MPFCVKCGRRIIDGARFCGGCGTPVEASNINNQRNQEWAGKLVKCPSCGEYISSFTVNCPACGTELRDARSSGAIIAIHKIIPTRQQS